MKNIREMTQKTENLLLSPYASHSSATKGRVRPEPEDDIRTPYQRDRDRIVHCNAFRRLQHKTQVFLSPTGDHYRTRLTHTIEVAQIARTIARGLELNEDLTEAISLGHDLGHTPFGHAGERALNSVISDGFKHEQQSLRVVDVIEKGGEGLNLTWEVRNGILNHSMGGNPETLEGCIVQYADRIAYINHDIDDAIRAGILTEEQLPDEFRDTLGKSKSERINRLVLSLIENSGEQIKMDPIIEKCFLSLRDYMTEYVYTNPECKGEERKVKDFLQQIFWYFESHPEEMPMEYYCLADKYTPSRAACDYISGMSDRYILSIYSELFIPKPWAE